MNNSSSKTGPARAAHPPIFRGIDMYIDPTGIPERPALVRRLKMYGASKPCHNPRDAEIIIVSTSSSSGRRFIRDWSNDPNKVVLAVAWVEDCIKQGKPLLLAEEWGGHATEDDGLPIPDGDADLDQTEEDSTNRHLPTPRQTPKESISKTQPKSPAPKAAEGNTSEPKTTVQRPQHVPETVPPQTEENIPPPVSAPAIPSDQKFAGSPQQYPPVVFTGPPGTYPQQIYLQQPISAVGGYPMLIQIQPEHYAPNMVPQNPQYPYGFQMPNGMVAASLNLNASYPPQQVSPPASTSQLHAMDVDSTASPPPSSANILDSEPAFQTDSSGRVDSFAEAYSSLQSNTRKRKSKSRHHRESSRARRHTTTPEPASESGADDLSSVELLVPPSQRSQPSSTQKGGRKIFVGLDGKPLQFFVMVNMHGRRADFIQKIKGCGGVVTSDIGTADYAILRNDGKGEFRTHYSQCLSAGTTAVSPRFIDDCIDEERILDADDYGFETASHSPKKKRQSQQISAPASPKRHRKQRDDPQRPRKKTRSTADSSTPAPSVSPSPSPEPPKKEKQRLRQKEPTSPVLTETFKLEPIAEASSKPKTEPKSASSIAPTNSSRPSPPPPPPHTRKEFSQGRWYYTAEDVQCAKDYAQVLLERDPEITNTSICNKLHKKMPYHSAASWSVQLGNKIGIEAIRALVERRLRLYGTTLGKGPIKEEQDVPVSTQTSPGKSRRGNQERLAAEDFEFILEFFKTGGADDEDDSRVWANLSAKRPCRTAEDWPTFYERNKEAIDSTLVAHYTAQGQRQDG